MENRLMKILDNYNNCTKMPDCASCKAWEKIPNTETNWCEFLRKRDEKIYEKIEKALE